MGAKSGQVKGHAKEVAGIVTGNDELRARGKADRVAAEAQEAVDQAQRVVNAGLDAVQTHALTGLDKTKKVIDGAFAQARGFLAKK